MAFDLLSAFVLGLLTPLTAVCVLPLFPGFLSFITQQSGLSNKYAPALFGLIVSLGVILFMMLVGLVFSTFFEVSLTNVVLYVTPVAMGVLLVISLLLIFDVDFSKMFPHIKTPQSKNPYVNALLFGFFFGAIVLPCQPGFIAAMFAQSLISGLSIVSFLFFGLGMAAPLLLFSLISLVWSRQILSFLTRYKSVINRVAGSIMFVVVVYYLFFEFRIHERLFGM